MATWRCLGVTVGDDQYLTALGKYGYHFRHPLDVQGAAIVRCRKELCMAKPKYALLSLVGLAE
jgi:hypothetical protein